MSFPSFCAKVCEKVRCVGGDEPKVLCLASLVRGRLVPSHLDFSLSLLRKDYGPELTKNMILERMKKSNQFGVFA